MAIISESDQPGSPRRIFAFLLLYRWLSLIPPLVTLSLSEDRRLALIIFFVAAGINVVISLFPSQLNQITRSHPWVLIFDLILMGGLIAVSGGWHSAYYLYTLNPLLAAAFFFQWRGALVAIGSYLPLYIGGVLVSANFNNDSFDWLSIITAIVGFCLIGGVFGYASSLVDRLRATGDGLIQAHRDLEIIHDLTLSLQSAADVEEVQERVLEAVTINLGFSRAVVGLVDHDRGIITGWLGRVRNGEMLTSTDLPHMMQTPLAANGGAVAEAVLSQKVNLVENTTGLFEGWSKEEPFGLTTCRIFPMILREHPVGVLLVDASTDVEDPARLRSLQSIANQAAVAIGTTMMCIDRAQRLAVQDERLRIAQDIHDTVSQALFGIVYTLEGSLKILPEQPEVVVPELKRALRVAEDAHQEVRQSILNIWPSEMTAVNFTDGLRKYVNDICRADGLQIDFHINGNFDHLSAQARRGLYRIAQEALANASRHASASQATVTLEVVPKQARLIVIDNGRGFDPAAELAREYDREHFGLRGMQERAHALDGQCEFNSQPGDGTAVVVDIPLRKGNQ